MAERKISDKLDIIIHERVRLLILTHLASRVDNAILFKELQSVLELTAGNLSVQLKTLERAGYCVIKKEFVNNKPQTSVCISDAGRDALQIYLGEMEKIIENMRLNGPKVKN